MIALLRRLFGRDKRTNQCAQPDNAPPTASGSVDESERLLSEGNAHTARGEYAFAIEIYRRILLMERNHPAALHNLGAALCNVGQFQEAEGYFRMAIQSQPDFPEAHNNLGFVLRALGRYAQAEVSIRRAENHAPIRLAVQGNLGHTLMLLGRTQEARDCFLNVLSVVPEQTDAIVGLGHVARLEGHVQEAEDHFRRALKVNPGIPSALASLAHLRRMTPSDKGWLESALKAAASEIPRTEAIELHFAIGKYCDDLGDFRRAFESYSIANEMLKSTAPNYDRQARERYVEDVEQAYSAEVLMEFAKRASKSRRPVFVVGMPRSGTSLVEQIIASHPNAVGAGELGFWTDAMIKNLAAVRQATVPAAMQDALAAEYLKLLHDHSADALCVVDKAPVNSEYLGLIHSVFPEARVIYLRRNPIDTCLSCYFQYLSPALSYTMDLSDLAHYYRHHHRLAEHWAAVLPADKMLEVPYEGLVADQEAWIRRILDFIGLAWDARCLDFHRTKRAVVTASSLQVRRKMYTSSVGRWRNYEQYIGPLLALGDLKR